MIRMWATWGIAAIFLIAGVTLTALGVTAIIGVPLLVIGVLAIGFALFGNRQTSGRKKQVRHLNEVSAPARQPKP
ncbi:MAG: hypothetical protein IMW91_03420 [Firmicutes bacterium]|nr:hypothetical protein [Bacillota bacterium]